MPAELGDFAFVTPIEAWSLTDAMTGRGESALVLGFRVDGKWGGLQLPLPVASDIALTLGRWFTDYVQAQDGDGA